MASQLEVFPRQIVDFMPFEPKRTAHAFGRAIVEGGDVYFVKGVDNCPVCATEWIASYLAQVLHLPVPEHSVLQMPDGSLVFGSRAIPNILSSLETNQILFSPTPPNNLVSPDLPEAYSALFAFDLAIGNPDRHHVNYLFSSDTNAESGRRVARLRPMDFDMSDLLAPELRQHPMSRDSHTVRTARQIQELKGFRSDSATALLTRLQKGREMMLENALHGLPREWLPPLGRGDLMKRVASAEFSNRLAQVTQGLSNGTYF